MTLIDKIKVLDDKIKANQAQYNLDREAAKISALSSDELDKYELFTGKDLGFKRGVVEKFEYSALGEVFNKGLEKKKERKRTFEKIKKYWRQEWKTIQWNYRSRRKTIGFNWKTKKFN